jgi:formate dehydrogenase subunit gamma
MPESSKTTHSMRIYNRKVTRRAVMDAFNRLQPLRAGQSQVIRFKVENRVEHFFLILTFFVLGITGLAQTFDGTPVGKAALVVLGGVEGAQQVHHLFALILCALAVYHGLMLLDGYFVSHQTFKMLPVKSDLRHLFQLLTFNLGLSKKLPLYDRYSFDEKFIYWVTFIAVIVLSTTGLVMWFPILATQVIPGSFFLYAQVLHRWQAIFAILVMLLLHTYQVFGRNRNFSIFTGRMSLADMQADHPVELAYLEQSSSLAEATSLPKTVRFSIEEPVAKRSTRKPRTARPGAEIIIPEGKVQLQPEIKPIQAGLSNSNDLPAINPPGGEID